MGRGLATRFGRRNPRLNETSKQGRLAGVQTRCSNVCLFADEHMMGEGKAVCGGGGRGGEGGAGCALSCALNAQSWTAGAASCCTHVTPAVHLISSPPGRLGACAHPRRAQGISRCGQGGMSETSEKCSSIGYAEFV
jgi:hypothetical protein